MSIKNSEGMSHRFKERGIAAIRAESQAVAALAGRIDYSFAKACMILLHCQGRIVVTGMGKSGHIGKKIAATLASTGSPSFFVHPGEASHGDLGMITSKDVVLALSNSGETDEILTIIPRLKHEYIPLISMTGNLNSTLARIADVNLDTSVAKEACPLDLAPTSSTTAALVMGDALAVALLEERGFTADDFARSHPGGRLGKRLLLKVHDIMHTNGELPVVQDTALLSEAVAEMNRVGLGITAVVNADNVVVGVYTDGDMRRSFDRRVNFYQVSVAQEMTANCKTISPNHMLADVVDMMQTHKINGLLVVDADNRLQGVMNMQDLLRAGVV